MQEREAFTWACLARALGDFPFSYFCDETVSPHGRDCFALAAIREAVSGLAQAVREDAFKSSG